MTDKEKEHFMGWSTSISHVSSRDPLATPTPRRKGRYEGMTPEALEAMFAEVHVAEAHELLAPRGVVGKEQVED